MWWYRINIRCSRAEVTGNVYTPKTSLNFVVWFSVFLRLSRSLSAPAIGLTENAGRENDGPSKLQGMKLQDMKLQDIKLQDRKLQDMKMPDMKMQDMKMTDQK